MTNGGAKATVATKETAAKKDQAKVRRPKQGSKTAKRAG